MPITLENTKIILEQLKKCICRIKIKESQGTGFFCFISFNEKSLPVLVFPQYMISEELNEICVELNETSKTIKFNDGRKIYFNKELFIAIVEIIPSKDLFFDFLEIDKNIFASGSRNLFADDNVYALQNSVGGKKISYGKIKSINEDTIHHLCSTENGSGGAPILNLLHGKIIGFHTSSSKTFNFNIGTFLKTPINTFIDMNKNYIISNGLTSTNYSYQNCIYTVNNTNNINLNNEIKIDNNIENELIQEKEKVKELEEKLKELNNVLKDKISKANSIITNNYQTIDELKLKLSRFPFELSEGEKLMSVVVTSSDKKIIRAFICKNTDAFCDLEKKLYQNNKKNFDIGNYFTVNGRNIDENKSLESNQINDNDIIVLNNLRV